MVRNLKAAKEKSPSKKKPARRDASAEEDEILKKIINEVINKKVLVKKIIEKTPDKEKQKSIEVEEIKEVKSEIKQGIEGIFLTKGEEQITRESSGERESAPLGLRTGALERNVSPLPATRGNDEDEENGRFSYDTGRKHYQANSPAANIKYATLQDREDEVRQITQGIPRQFDPLAVKNDPSIRRPDFQNIPSEIRKVMDMNLYDSLEKERSYSTSTDIIDRDKDPRKRYHIEKK